MALISNERIYQYIAADRKAGGSLWKQLRCRKRRRRHRCGTPRQRQRFGGRHIAQRLPADDAKMAAHGRETEEVPDQMERKRMRLS